MEVSASKAAARIQVQKTTAYYIVDFVCFERRVIIEADGGQHMAKKQMDNKRDKWFNEQGFKVLRFWNNEVLRDIASVLKVIRKNCLHHPPLTPPIKGGELKGSR